MLCLLMSRFDVRLNRKRAMRSSRSSNTNAGIALRAALLKLLRAVRRAVDSFSEDPSTKAHAIRTRIKRAQALARLVPDASQWRGEFLQICGEVKDLFAPCRDAEILASLVEKYALGEAFQLDRPSEPDLNLAAMSADRALGHIVRCSKWPSIEWRGLSGRAAETYRAARNAWKHARRTNATDAAFHKFRRKLKRLLYQLEHMGSRIHLMRLTRRLDRLGEILGEIQDICLAEDWLKRELRVAGPADLARSKASLRRDALKRAEALFSPRTKDFRRMLF